MPVADKIATYSVSVFGPTCSELDLGIGETPGEGNEDPQSLEALIRRARREGTDRA